MIRNNRCLYYYMRFGVLSAMMFHLLFEKTKPVGATFSSLQFFLLHKIIPGFGTSVGYSSEVNFALVRSRTKAGSPLGGKMSSRKK